MLQAILIQFRTDMTQMGDKIYKLGYYMGNKIDKLGHKLRTIIDKIIDDQTVLLSKIINDSNLKVTESDNNKSQEVELKTNRPILHNEVEKQSASLSKQFDDKLIGMETKANREVNRLQEIVNCANDTVIKYQGECQGKYPKSGVISNNLNNDSNSFVLNQEILTSKLKIKLEGKLNKVTESGVVLPYW